MCFVADFICFYNRSKSACMHVCVIFFNDVWSQLLFYFLTNTCTHAGTHTHTHTQIINYTLTDWWNDCVIQRTYMKGRKPCNIFYMLYISNNEYMNNTAKAKQTFYIQFSTLMTISLFLVFNITRVHFTRHCSYTSHRKHNWSVFNSVRRSNIIRQLNNYHCKHIWSASNSSRYNNTSW